MTDDLEDLTGGMDEDDGEEYDFVSHEDLLASVLSDVTAVSGGEDTILVVLNPKYLGTQELLKVTFWCVQNDVPMEIGDMRKFGEDEPYSVDLLSPLKGKN